MATTQKEYFFNTFNSTATRDTHDYNMYYDRINDKVYITLQNDNGTDRLYELSTYKDNMGVFIINTILTQALINRNIKGGLINEGISRDRVYLFDRPIALYKGKKTKFTDYAINQVPKKLDVLYVKFNNDDKYYDITDPNIQLVFEKNKNSINSLLSLIVKENTNYQLKSNPSIRGKIISSVYGNKVLYKIKDSKGGPDRGPYDESSIEKVNYSKVKADNIPRSILGYETSSGLKTRGIIKSKYKPGDKVFIKARGNTEIYTIDSIEGIDSRLILRGENGILSGAVTYDSDIERVKITDTNYVKILNPNGTYKKVPNGTKNSVHRVIKVKKPYWSGPTLYALNHNADYPANKLELINIEDVTNENRQQELNREKAKLNREKAKGITKNIPIKVGDEFLVGVIRRKIKQIPGMFGGPYKFTGISKEFTKPEILDLKRL